MLISDKFLRRGKRTASRIYGDTTVVLLLRKGSIADRRNRLFELDSASTFVWKLIEEPLKLKVIIDKVIKEKKLSCGKKKAMLLVNKLLKFEIAEITDIPEKAY